MIKTTKQLKDETIFYEDEEGFGIYCDKGLDPEKIIKTIKELDSAH